MQHYLYLLIDLACLSIPLLCSFYKPHPFYKQWPAFCKANIIVGLLFIAWDVVFTKKGIWGFNPDYLMGVYIFDLPLEEILFFFCIPYACVFTFFALQYLIPKKWYARNIPYWLFLLFTLEMAFFFQDKAYTFWTFILLSLTLGFVLIKRININLETMAYLLIFPFFLLSNGILTGSLLPSPIVWYNDAENIGYRLFTIPYEDFFYGYLLILSHLLLFNFFNKKKET